MKCHAMKQRAALLGLAVLAGTSAAQEKVLNLYSSRHYQTDEALYTGFTKATGIKNQPHRSERGSR